MLAWNQGLNTTPSPFALHLLWIKHCTQMFSLADQHWQHYSLFPANTHQTFPEESFHFSGWKVWRDFSLKRPASFIKHQHWTIQQPGSFSNLQKKRKKTNQRAKQSTWITATDPQASGHCLFKRVWRCLLPVKPSESCNPVFSTAERLQLQLKSLTCPMLKVRFRSQTKIFKGS